MQSDKTSFAVDVFKTLIGYVPIPDGMVDYYGIARDIADIVSSAVNWSEDQKNDFRNIITNESDADVFRIGEIDAVAQLDKYNYLLKNAVVLLETRNDADALLFGMEGNCYVTNTFYCNYADSNNKWNTGFAGTIRFDIVEEDKSITGSTISDVATDIESNSIYKSIWNEETTELQLDEEVSLYALSGVENSLVFSAPFNGIYTIETSGETNNDISSDLGTITKIGNNSRLTVRLKSGDTLSFKSCNLESRRSIYNIVVRFTPESFVDGRRELTIEPNNTEYVSLEVTSPDFFKWSVSGEGSIGVAVSRNSPTAFVIDNEAETLPSGMLFAKNIGT